VDDQDDREYSRAPELEDLLSLCEALWIDNIVRAQRPERLPGVLTIEEVRDVIARVGAARQARRGRDGVRAVAVRDSVLRTSFAATAAPLQLRHGKTSGQQWEVQVRVAR